MARDKKNNNLVEFMVGDITESRYEEACRFMIKHFLPHEPKIVARNSQNDPLVIDDYFEKYMHGIKKKVSIACYKKGSKEFIGVNILEVLGRNDPISSFQVSWQQKMGRKPLKYKFAAEIQNLSRCYQHAQLHSQ